MAYKINPLPLEDFTKAAKMWRQELLMLPVLAMGDVTKFLTLLPGCTTNQFLGSANIDAQFAPYEANKRNEGGADLVYRELEIYFGSMNVDFIPNDYIQTLLGKGAASKGDAMKGAPLAKLIIANVMKNAGHNMASALFTAKRNTGGTKSADLFNGFATIAEKEIQDGNLSADKGNFVQLSEDITKANCVDVIKNIVFELDPQLRRQECFLYCDPAILDKYNEAYKLTGASLVYNTQYEQAYVEGSNHRITFAPVDSLAGSKLMFIAPKENMVYGFDSMSDLEQLEVLRLDVDTLTLAAKTFVGTQFRTLDKRMLKVIKQK